MKAVQAMGDGMSERERMAEVWVNEQICFGGLEFPRGGETFKDCVKSYLAGWDAAIEAAAKLVEFRVEHLSSDPNYNGGYENLMRGLLLAKAEMIRALGGEDERL